jgi:CheY-like chemotaxis protein
MGTAASKKPVVLIVEDESLILLSAIDTIVAAGFEAIWATNADEAIVLLESRDDIRVIFTDIDMPGSMDGLKLAHAVRKRWPPVRIIVTSGIPLADDRSLPEQGVFFRKPYDPAQITRTLHEFTA